MSKSLASRGFTLKGLPYQTVQIADKANRLRTVITQYEDIPLETRLIALSNERDQLIKMVNELHDFWARQAIVILSDQMNQIKE